MALTVHNLKHDTRKVTLSYAGEDVTITYRPSAWTPETEDTLFDEDEGRDAYIELMENLIVEWDVMADDVTPLEPTVENLRKLPSPFLVWVTRKVWEDMSPGEARKLSGGGSRRRG